MKTAHAKRREQGMALLISLIMLAVLSIMATTFISNITIDQKAASNLAQEMNGKFIAEAGVHHALCVLGRDADFFSSDPDITFEAYDWAPGDEWNTHFTGSDVNIADTVSRLTGDVDTTSADAKWIYMHSSPGDANSPVIGRYAVLIQDENAKVNINTAGAGYDASESSQQGEATDEIDLEDLFENISGIADSKAADITNYSHKPFAELTELRKISGIGQAEYEAAAPYLTTLSADHDLYYDTFHTPTGFSKKVQINYEPRIEAFAGNLFNHLSWSNTVKEYLCAVNLFDYRDSDNVPTVYSEADIGVDINSDSAISSSTYIYGVEGIQINEILTNAWVTVDVNSGNITKTAGNFTDMGTYFTGTSTDFTHLASATFELPWDNGTYKVKIHSLNTSPTDDFLCRVEGVGYNTVPGGGLLEYTITVTDGSITIEIQDPVQTDGAGNLSGTQIPSKFEKTELNCGEFIEIVNISRKDVTIPANWTFVFDNGTPANSGDDRIYHLPASVSLSGAVISSTDPKTATYDYLILTNSEKALDMLFDTVVNGSWDGTAAVSIPLDSTNNLTFSILDSGDDSITIKNNNADVIDHIDSLDSNDYCVSGYKPAGGLTDWKSREKRSPDYDLEINGVSVWNDSSTATNDPLYFATPGKQNSGANYYVTVRDEKIPNPYFIYDLAKNENHNSPSNALTAAKNYLITLEDMLGFYIWEVEGENIQLKFSWALTTVGTDSFLALSSAVTSGAKITLLDSAGPSVPDGQYRIFNESMDSDEIHKISGTHLDISSSTVTNANVNVNFNKERYGCLNGQYVTSSEYPMINDELKHRYDYLLPFTVKTEYFTLEDNCAPSTATTQNTIKNLVFQPVGFNPLIAGKINVNTADVYTIATLPEVSSVLSYNIVNDSLSTPFTSTAQLLNVTGMTFSQYCKIANLVTVRSNNFKVTVLSQSIKDINKNGFFDSGDLILDEEKCVSSIYRGVENDSDELPQKIKLFTKYFYWE